MRNTLPPLRSNELLYSAHSEQQLFFKTIGFRVHSIERMFNQSNYRVDI